MSDQIPKRWLVYSYVMAEEILAMKAVSLIKMSKTIVTCVTNFIVPLAAFLAFSSGQILVTKGSSHVTDSPC